MDRLQDDGIKFEPGIPTKAEIKMELLNIEREIDEICETYWQQSSRSSALLLLALSFMFVLATVPIGLLRSRIFFPTIHDAAFVWELMALSCTAVVLCLSVFLPTNGNAP